MDNHLQIDEQMPFVLGDWIVEPSTGRMHAGDPRGDAGGAQGPARLPGWGARERAELARTAVGPEESRTGNGAPSRCWRRGLGILGGAA